MMGGKKAEEAPPAPERKKVTKIYPKGYSALRKKVATRKIAAALLERASKKRAKKAEAAPSEEKRGEEVLRKIKKAIEDRPSTQWWELMEEFGVTKEAFPTTHYSLQGDIQKLERDELAARGKLMATSKFKKGQVPKSKEDAWVADKHKGEWRQALIQAGVSEEAADRFVKNHAYEYKRKLLIWKKPGNKNLSFEFTY